MSGANLNASTSTTSSSATTITPRTSPSPRETQNGRFASLSPSKPGGLVRRPSLARQTTVTPGAGGVVTGSNAADRRRSLVNGAGAGVEGVKSPGELTVFVDKLLSDLEGKFDSMSHDLLERMNHMSDRIDQIETSIHDLISTDLDHDHHHHQQQQQQQYPAVSVSNSDLDDSRDNGQTGRDVEGQGGNGSRVGSEQSLLLAEPPLGVVEGSP
ncbi:hypothetical protein HD553DRAFT_303632 [Filobasidium floriforme]|uniref:uncharacterized protein n=1 Tax=Filobasidium floriforme TaxID=5210 RepID=UPI001E8D6C1D|nr:uncharacterized protein HD553DRAFT_303632 [Filobasidium floriforme]KAH8090873.1 hypothetical protein HD553DRAFT_303632 [Filobasidium floriforme]